MTYDEARAVVAAHSEHGIKDRELIEVVGVLLGVLDERFSREGEYRGGSDAADALEQVNVVWRVFEGEASWSYPA